MQINILIVVLCFIAFAKACSAEEQMSATFKDLLDSSQEVRDEARAKILQQPLAKVQKEVRDLFQLKNATPTLLRASLIVLHDKDSTKMPEMLPLAMDNASPMVRATALALTPGSALTSHSHDLVRKCLQDASLLVRVQAARILLDADPADTRDLESVLINALSSDESDSLTDPPKPAFVIAKELLYRMKNTNDILSVVNRKLQDGGNNEIVRGHLQDLVSRIKGRKEKFIYMHVGPPTEEEKKLLEP